MITAARVGIPFPGPPKAYANWQCAACRRCRAGSTGRLSLHRQTPDRAAPQVRPPPLGAAHCRWRSSSAAALAGDTTDLSLPGTSHNTYATVQVLRSERGGRTQPGAHHRHPHHPGAPGPLLEQAGPTRRLQSCSRPVAKWVPACIDALHAEQHVPDSLRQQGCPASALLIRRKQLRPVACLWSPRYAHHASNS